MIRRMDFDTLMKVADYPPPSLFDDARYKSDEFRDTCVFQQ